MYVMYKTIKSPVASFVGYKDKVIFISTENMKDALEIIKDNLEKEAGVEEAALIKNNLPIPGFPLSGLYRASITGDKGPPFI